MHLDHPALPGLPGLPGVPSGAVPFAHGIGGAKDLPVPAGVAIAGAMPRSPSRSSCSRWPGAARGTTPPRAAGRPRPGSRRRRLAPPGTSRCASLGLLLLRATSPWRRSSARTCSPTRSSGSSTCWCGSGWSPLSLLFGPVCKAVSPVRTINLLFARLTGRRPRRGLYALPARGWATGRRRSGCSRSCGWSWSTRTRTELGPVRLWCAVYLAVDARRRRRCSAAPVLRERRPVRGLLHPGRAPVGVGAAATTAARGPQPAGQPRRRSRSAPGLVGGGRGAVRQHRVRLLQGLHAWLRFAQSQRRRAPRGSTTSACWCSALVVGVLFAVGDDGHRGRATACARRTLPNLFAHSVVPIIVGYIVAHYLTYFVEVGQQTLVQAQRPARHRREPASAPPTWQVSYWLSDHPTFLA